MAIGKSSMENQIKKAENIFLLTCTEISKIFNIKYLQWSKTDLSKETKKKKKKDFKERLFTNFSSSHPEVYC